MKVLDRTVTLTMEGRFLRMMMKSTEWLLRRNGSREETVKYIRLNIFLMQQNIKIFVNSTQQKLAPSVVGLVSDLDYMRTKIQNLRRRWNDIQTSHLNQVGMRGSLKHKSSV